MIATIVGVRHCDFVSKDKDKPGERIVGESLQIVKAPAPDDTSVQGQLIDKVFLREGNPLIGKYEVGTDNELTWLVASVPVWLISAR